MKIKKRNTKGFYQIDGLDYPSVTTIIDSLGVDKALMYWYGKLGYEEAERVLHASAKYGTQIHKRLHDWIFEKQEITQDEDCYNRAIQIKQWIHDNKLIPVEGEKIIWNTEFEYAGTCDGLFKVQDTEDYILVDFKTGTERKWKERIQLGAYAHCENIPKIEYAFAIHIGKSDDAIVKFIEHANDELLDGFIAFKNMLNINHFKKNLRSKK